MDERQQRQVEEAAQKFAEALKDSYQSIAERSVSAQELNARLTQDFFNGVINNLRTQAQNNRALSEELVGQHKKQQEATQALAQESIGAYMDFLNSMFGYPQQGERATGRVIHEVDSEQQGTGDEAAIMEDDAVRYPLNTWVSTSGRSRSRGRNARSRGRASRR